MTLSGTEEASVVTLPIGPAPDGGPAPELVARLRASLLDGVRMPSGQERFRSFTTAAFAADGAGFLVYVQDLRKRRRADPGTDLIDDLIAARDGDERLTEPELVRLVVALIAAGHETTAAALSRGALTLLAEPKRYQRLVAQPALIPAAVEEILRLNPPVDMSLLRVAAEDVELASGTVPRGRAVLASLVATRRCAVIRTSSPWTGTRRWRASIWRSGTKRISAWAPGWRGSN